VCPGLLYRLFHPGLKKRVKITWYFSKTDGLALGESSDRNCARKWIDRGGPITWYPRSPKLTSLDSHFVVTRMLLTLHHYQPICHKFLERYQLIYFAMHTDVWNAHEFRYLRSHATHDTVTESCNASSVVDKILITKLPEEV
jgi:hypothetical protein